MITEDISNLLARNNLNQDWQKKRKIWSVWEKTLHPFTLKINGQSALFFEWFIWSPAWFDKMFPIYTNPYFDKYEFVQIVWSTECITGNLAVWICQGWIGTRDFSNCWWYQKFNIMINTVPGNQFASQNDICCFKSKHFGVEWSLIVKISVMFLTFKVL